MSMKTDNYFIPEILPTTAFDDLPETTKQDFTRQEEASYAALETWLAKDGVAQVMGELIKRYGLPEVDFKVQYREGSSDKCIKWTFLATITFQGFGKVCLEVTEKGVKYNRNLYHYTGALNPQVVMNADVNEEWTNCLYAASFLGRSFTIPS